MARVEINEAALAEVMREWLTRRARVALQVYVDEPLLRDSGSYPFERHEQDRSIRDPASHTITPTPLGIRITITAAGAPYIEEGNEPDGGIGEIVSPSGDDMYIPLRPGAENRFAGANSKGTVKITSDGRLYFVTKSVQPYRGTHRLRRAVRTAFGIGL